MTVAVAPLEAASDVERPSYLAASLARLGEAGERADLIEIAMNPDGRVWAEFQGDTGMSPLPVRFTDDEARNFASRIASSASVQLSSTRPIISVSVMHRGRPIRAQVAIRPAVAGTAISLRYFASRSLDAIRVGWLHGKPVSQDEVRRVRNARLREVASSGDLSAALAFCARERLSVVVSGGTNTGKTVVLRKLLAEVDEADRIVTIEDAAELHPGQPNAVTLIASRDDPVRSVDTLLTAALRMRPDRIILGELRGAEALGFLEAINTGHGGSMTTLHAETPRLAIRRLAIAASKSRVPMTYAELVGYIEDTIDVVVQVGRAGDRRGVTEFHLPGLARSDERIPT